MRDKVFQAQQQDAVTGALTTDAIGSGFVSQTQHKQPQKVCLDLLLSGYQCEYILF